MHSAFWGELAGTAMLILLGNGVVAGVVLKKSYGYGSGWMVITTGWCFAVLAGVITALALGSHAHLNPAVTIGLAVAGGYLDGIGVPACVASGTRAAHELLGTRVAR